MDISNWINIGILVLTLIGLYIAVATLKRDNRISNEETIDRTLKSALSDQATFFNLERRVSLLEQKVDLTDQQTIKEIQELKKIIHQYMG